MPVSAPDASASRVSLWAPVAIYMGAIFVLSSMSQPPSPPQVSDKTQHFAAYGGLGLVALRATSGGRLAGVTAGAAAAAWAVASAYGVSDEIHQRFVPGRSPEAADVIADALGAAAAILGAFGIIRGSRALSGRG